MIAAEVRTAAASAYLLLAAAVPGAIAFTPSPLMAQQLAALDNPLVIETRALHEPNGLWSNNMRVSHAGPMKSAAEEFCAFTMVPTLIERRYSCMWLCERASASALQWRPEWEK